MSNQQLVGRNRAVTRANVQSVLIECSILVPIFAAEVSPAHIRGDSGSKKPVELPLIFMTAGSLVMNWQLFDAFGIFLYLHLLSSVKHQLTSLITEGFQLTWRYLT